MQKKLVYIWNPATYDCENGEYVANVIDNSVIPCDEIVEKKKKTLPTKSVSTKTVPTNFNEKNVTCKTKSFIFYQSFY